MILIEIKNYIAQKNTATLQELSFRFQRDPELMRQMLQHWIRKGVIIKLDAPVGCGSRCTQCRPEIAQEYAINIQ